MKAVNVFFSPTGGTKNVSSAFAKAIGEDIIELDLNKTPEKVQMENDCLCIFSAPVYGGRIPAVCAERLDKITGCGTPCVIVAVFGNRAVDDALAELCDIVKAKGFVPIAAVEAVAQHSLAPVYASGRPDKADEAELADFAKKIKEKLESGVLTIPHIPGNRPYKQAATNPMTLLLDESCVKCGKCARECPVGAINGENVSEYDKSLCFACQRCVAVCPKNARHNSKEVTEAIIGRLKGRADGHKENKLYL